MINEYTQKERFKATFKEFVPYYGGVDDVRISRELPEDVTWPDLEPIPAGHIVVCMSDRSVRDAGLASEFLYALFHQSNELNEEGEQEFPWVQNEEEWLGHIRALVREGKPNGLAQLNDAGEVPAEQLPSYVDDVLEGYVNPAEVGPPPQYSITKFYKTKPYDNTKVYTPESDKIYVDIDSAKTYRWSGSKYVLISQATDVLNDSITKNDATSIYYTWTVQKLMTALKSYNPEFFESISMGRIANSTKGTNSMAIGTSVTAAGENSVAEGEGTIANGKNQHAFGKYNVANNTSLEIVGNGTSTARSNARTLDASGNEWLAGNLQTAKNLSVGGTTSLTGKVTASNDVDIAQNLAVTGTINGKTFVSTIPYHDNVKDTDVPTNAAVENYVVAWMDYEQIEIKSLSVKATTVSPTSPTAANDGNLVERGSTVTQAKLSYELNKDATAMKLDNAATTNDSGNTDYKDTITRTVSLNNTDKTWTFYVEDTRPNGSHKNASKQATLSFVNRVFYGPAAIPTSPNVVDSAFVRGLRDSVLDSDGVVSNISITTGNGQHMWYCSTKGTCKFNVGGFDGGFEPPMTVYVKDAGGVDTAYYVYRSTNSNLGTKIVKVS